VFLSCAGGVSKESWIDACADAVREGVADSSIWNGMAMEILLWPMARLAFGKGFIETVDEGRWSHADLDVDRREENLFRFAEVV
jgi:hypothetical protein